MGKGHKKKKKKREKKKAVYSESCPRLAIRRQGRNKTSDWSSFSERERKRGRGWWRWGRWHTSDHHWLQCCRRPVRLHQSERGRCLQLALLTAGHSRHLKGACLLKTSFFHHLLSPYDVSDKVLSICVCETSGQVLLKFAFQANSAEAELRKMNISG